MAATDDRIAPLLMEESQRHGLIPFLAWVEIESDVGPILIKLGPPRAYTDQIPANCHRKKESVGLIANRYVRQRYPIPRSSRRSRTSLTGSGPPSSVNPYP